MHEILVNCLGGLSLPRKSEARLTDRPDMTLDVYRGPGNTLEGDVSDVIALDQLTSPFSPRKATKMSP